MFRSVPTEPTRPRMMEASMRHVFHQNGQIILPTLSYRCARYEHTHLPFSSPHFLRPPHQLCSTIVYSISTNVLDSVFQFPHPRESVAISSPRRLSLARQNFSHSSHLRELIWYTLSPHLCLPGRYCQDSSSENTPHYFFLLCWCACCSRRTLRRRSQPAGLSEAIRVFCFLSWHYRRYLCHHLSSPQPWPFIYTFRRCFASGKMLYRHKLRRPCRSSAYDAYYGQKLIALMHVHSCSRICYRRASAFLEQSCWFFSPMALDRDPPSLCKFPSSYSATKIAAPAVSAEDYCFGFVSWKSQFIWHSLSCRTAIEPCLLGLVWSFFRLGWPLFPCFSVFSPLSW